MHNDGGGLVNGGITMTSGLGLLGRFEGNQLNEDAVNLQKQ